MFSSISLWIDADNTRRFPFTANRNSNYLGIYECLKLAKNEPRMGILTSSFCQTCLPNFKYFLVVTAQWKFLHSFLSSMPPNVLGFISKFQIFFRKLALIRVRDLEYFCDQYSSIVPTFNYIRVTTVQWNFLHNFFSLIPRCVFGFISKFKIFFEKLRRLLTLFRVRDF